MTAIHVTSSHNATRPRLTFTVTIDGRDIPAHAEVSIWLGTGTVPDITVTEKTSDGSTSRRYVIDSYELTARTAPREDGT